MSEASGSGNDNKLKEELLTGIAKLVYKLSETADSINSKLEEFQKALPDMIKEGFSGIEEKLDKTNELLSGISMPEGILTEKTFKKELSDLSKAVTDKSGSLEKSMGKSIEKSLEKSDTGRGKVLEEKLKVIVDSLSDMSGKVEAAGKSLEEKLTEIKDGTTTEVAKIDESVKESSQAQKTQLEEMKELLTLHSVEVKDSKVRDLNRTAIMHFNNAEYDQAETALAEAIELSPESPELLTNIAHIKAAQGKLEDAEKDFRAALTIDPDLEPAISGLGIMLVHSGRAGETIEFLKKFFEDDATPSISVMIAMSRAYAAEGSHAKAVELLEKAEKVAPGHPEVEQELASYRK